MILVTHALHFLSNCDYIYTMAGGRIAEHGSYNDLIGHNGEFARLDREFGGNDPNAETKTQLVGAADIDAMKSKTDRAARKGAGVGKLGGKLMVKEKRTTGSLTWAGMCMFQLRALNCSRLTLISHIVYKTYLRAGLGWFTIPSIAMSILLMQGSQIVNSYTLVWWEAK